jgi:SPASM domain peptide maturase of grasp-with-spasm system
MALLSEYSLGLEDDDELHREMPWPLLCMQRSPELIPTKTIRCDSYASEKFVCLPVYKKLSRCVKESGVKVAKEKSSAALADLNDARVYVLYANCLPVKGARRSLIADLQGGIYRLIPNVLYEILTAHRGLSLLEIKNKYGKENVATIDSYFATLVGEGFLFECDDLEEFPPLDLTWESPALISNAILDVDASTNRDWRALFAELDQLGCEAIQIRSFSPLSNDAIVGILSQTSGLSFRHIDVILCHTVELPDFINELTYRFMAIHQVIVHSAPMETAYAATTYTKAVIKQVPYSISPNSCGETHPTLFAINIDHVAEARSFNSCLNRKLSVAADGSICGCPSQKARLGNIADVRLKDVVNDPGLRLLWQTTKDHVEVCRDCEFRYICTDCRVFTENGDAHAKPAKCTYDPYTAQWL